MYWNPALHDFDTTLHYDRRVKKIADRFYKCRGVQIYIHHVEGLTPENKVRVAIVIQFGKYVVL